MIEIIQLPRISNLNAYVVIDEPKISYKIIKNKEQYQVDDINTTYDFDKFNSALNIEEAKIAVRPDFPLTRFKDSDIMYLERFKQCKYILLYLLKALKCMRKRR